MSDHPFTESIDPRLFAGALERAVGVRPLELHLRKARLPRLVFEAQTPSGRVFLKAEVPNPDREYALALEAWALERAAASVIPVPEVLHVDCSERHFPFRFIVMSQVNGITLEDAKLGWDRENELLREAGRLLTRLHQTPVAGFGLLDEERYLTTGDVRGIRDDWFEPLWNQAIASATRLVQDGILSEHETESVFERLKYGSGKRSHEAGCRLLHGDLGSGAIFVEPATGRLAGIIDFNARQSGPPEWEMATFLVWENARRLRPLVEGYREAGGVLDEELISEYGLFRLLELMEWYAGRGRTKVVVEMKARLAEFL